ncbi:MAG: heme-binding domain-containing protein [Marinoscillum sp.]
MKKSFFTSVIVFTLFFSAHDLFAQKEGPEKTRVLLANTADSTQLLSYPMDVMAIITNKCLGCHSPNARNEESRDALQWIELQSMGAVDIVATLDEVSEVLEEGSMPPEKMLERFPHLKLTDEEVALLKAWVESTLTEVMGE